MKKIITILMLTVITAINVNAQILHPGDSITPHAYVNALYTDSATYRYNVPLRMTIDVVDHQDSTLGASVIVHLYYKNGSEFAPAVGAQFRGLEYANWDVDNDFDIYKIVANIWLKQSLKLVYQR